MGCDFYVDAAQIARGVAAIKSVVSKINNASTNFNSLKTGIPQAFPNYTSYCESIIEAFSGFSQLATNLDVGLDERVVQLSSLDSDFEQQYIGFLMQEASSADISEEEKIILQVSASVLYKAEEKKELDRLLEKEKTEGLTKEEEEQKLYLQKKMEIYENEGKLLKIDKKSEEGQELYEKINEGYSALLRIEYKDDYTLLDDLYRERDMAQTEEERAEIQKRIDEQELKLANVEIQLLEYKKIPNVFGDDAVDSKNRDIDEKIAEKEKYLGEKGKEYVKQQREEWQKIVDSPYASEETKAKYKAMLKDSELDHQYMIAYYNTMAKKADLEIQKRQYDYNSEEYKELTKKQINLDIRLQEATPSSYRDENYQYNLEMNKWARDNVDQYISSQREELVDAYFNNYSYVSRSNYDFTNKTLEYSKLSASDIFWQNAVTFLVSTGEGIVDVGETIVDGTVQVVGGGAAWIVGKINEDAGHAMKDGIQSFVSYDASGAMYGAFVDATGINEDIAYGWAHTAGNLTGQVVGYAAITYFTGGAATVLLSGAAAAGSTAETAYASGASFDEALLASTANAVIGMAGGAAMNKVETFAKGAISLNGVAGYTATGAFIGAAEPLLNTAVDYATYGNNNGQSYKEYMNESGGWTKVAMGAGAGGLSLGTKSWKSYSGTEKYRKDVLSTIRKEIAESDYEALNGKGKFEKLPDDEKRNLMSSIDKKVLSEKEKLVDNSVKNAQNQYRSGVFDEKYTLGDVLEGYKEDQRKFWSKKAYEEWKADFGKYAKDGKVKVYSFQDGSIGARNIVFHGGNTSLPQGSFVMSERQYLDLLNDRTVFDSRGNCIDHEKLSDLTGGCNFGTGKNIIAVEQTVKLDEITLPYGSHPNAYPGWWSPGGKTVTKSGVGYCIEGIAPYNNYSSGNVNIISHNSRYNSKYYTNPLNR